MYSTWFRYMLGKSSFASAMCFFFPQWFTKAGNNHFAAYISLNWNISCYFFLCWRLYSTWYEFNLHVTVMHCEMCNISRLCVWSINVCLLCFSMIHYSNVLVRNYKSFAANLLLNAVTTRCLWLHMGWQLLRC